LRPYYDEDGITIYHADAREVLPALERADLLLTDPPYGIGGHAMTEGVSRRERAVASEWDAERPSRSLMLAAVDAADHAIVWGGNYFADMLPPSGKWLVWDKMQEFSGADVELAWTSWGGASRAFRLSRVEAHAGPEAVRGHPTPKPIRLMTWCLAQHESTGTVLDPFMGSGTTLDAAKREGRRAIGIEIEERYCEIAAKRLAQGVLPFA